MLGSPRSKKTNKNHVKAYISFISRFEFEESPPKLRQAKQENYCNNFLWNNTTYMAKFF